MIPIFVPMKRFLVMAVLFTFSCNQSKIKGVEKPDDLIPEDKMVQVLADVHLLEAALNIRFSQTNQHTGQGPIEMMHHQDTVQPVFSLDGNAKYPLGYYDIFKKEGVTKKQYESSMKWYCADPANLSKMYDDVIIELTKRQTKEKTGK